MVLRLNGRLLPCFPPPNQSVTPPPPPALASAGTPPEDMSARHISSQHSYLWWVSAIDTGALVCVCGGAGGGVTLGGEFSTEEKEGTLLQEGKQ